MQEAARAAVDEKAPGNLDLDHCHLFPSVCRQPKPIQGQVLYGRVDRSRAHFLDVIDYRVEALRGDADDIPSKLIDTEHQHTTAAACKYRKLIGERLATGPGNAVTRETRSLHT